MARNDIKLYEPIEGRVTLTPIVALNGSAPSILTGTPVKTGSAGAVVPMVDGDGTTSQRFAGLSKSDSTETTAVAGNVTLYIPLPGLIYSGVAKSATAANTQAKIDALFAKRVVFDLTGGIWTVDSAAADAVSNGLVIIGGDYQSNVLYFTIAGAVTILDNTTT